jgi:hypothetical protein
MATLTDWTSRAQQSDRIWVARSETFVDPDDGYYAVIKVPTKALITQVWIHIATAFTAAGAILTVGFEGNGDTAVTNCFFTTDIAKPTETGIKRSFPDVAVSVEGKWFDTYRGVITITTDDQGGTAGTFTVFAEFAEIF